MDVSRSCKIQDLNWALLPDLVARLDRQGWSVRNVHVDIRRYPDSLTFNSIDEALENIRNNRSPKHYTISLNGASRTFRLSRFRNIHDEEFIDLSLCRINDSSELDAVMEFLGLVPDEPTTLPPNPPRTAFLAHKFDKSGTDAADKVARFLEILGFTVQTGRGYLPGSVRDKVLARIERQALLFVVLTPSDDDTWLVQESVIADVKGKPLFVLKEQGAHFNAGVLADHEFIPFENSRVEGTFIPILEGLRELGYLNFYKDS